MATIERTAYPTFYKKYSSKELIRLFRPTQAELAFVSQQARNPQNHLLLLLYLKSHQYLGYFPPLNQIPNAIIYYLLDVLDLPKVIDLSQVASRSEERVRQKIRHYLNVKPYQNGGEALLRTLLNTICLTMSDPADLINASIDELVKNNFSLPLYSTLHRTVMHVRSNIHHQIYDKVTNGLSANHKLSLDQLLVLGTDTSITPFIKIKKDPAPATLSEMKQWKERYYWLLSIINTTDFLKDIAFTKIHQFASQAHSFETGDLKDFQENKRYTFLICLVHVKKMHTKDQLAWMFIKRMRKVHQKGKEKLETLLNNQRELEEHLLALLSEISNYVEIQTQDEKLGASIRDSFLKYGGIEQVTQKIQLVTQYHKDNYYPLLWLYHAPYRKTLFEILDILDIQSATQDDELLASWQTFFKYRQAHRKQLADSFSLSYASKKWQSQIIKIHNGRQLYDRRLLELCMETYLSEGLQTTDLFMEHSFLYGDYREQLLDWQVCKERLDNYCLQVELPNSAADFVTKLKEELKQTAEKTDRMFPENTVLVIDEMGKPHLKQQKRKGVNESIESFKKLVKGRMTDCSLLDVLYWVQHWTNYTKNFYPISGADTKAHNAITNYIFTLFSYGSGLGPTQTAQHTSHPISRRMISRINAQHIDAQKLQNCLETIANGYTDFQLSHLWGDKTAAVADGTYIPLTENNLLGERHIRYGGYGGIAYHHISDTYVALFSHFIACGVWEAVYILDGLMKNQSDLKPDKIHADTQGQNEPAFGLSYLLGIQLMPRIRNWQDLHLYRVNDTCTYQHIDSLFTRTIDWELIQLHWQDLMQVVISIQAGKILPSAILQKLGVNGRKTKLYKAFRELGRVIRTIFLLNFINDASFQQNIHKATTKIESFNSFCDWITFGGEKIMTGDPIEQEKRIKYTSVIANCIMLYNVAEMTRIVNQLKIEGYTITNEMLSRLNPYTTEKIRRFGDFVLNLENIPQPLTVKNII